MLYILDMIRIVGRPLDREANFVVAMTVRNKFSFFLIRM